MNTPKTEQLIGRTLGLDKEAAPAPWEPCIGSGNCECTALHFSGNDKHPLGLFVCDLIPDWALDDKYKTDLEFKPANMDFIAHSRTAAPLLARQLKVALKALEYYRGREVQIEEGRAIVLVHQVRTVPVFEGETLCIGDEAHLALAAIERIAEEGSG